LFTLPIGKTACQLRQHVQHVVTVGGPVDVPGVRSPGDMAGVLRIVPMRNTRADVIGVIVLFTPGGGLAARC
jgi:hypothetical protein